MTRSWSKFVAAAAVLVIVVTVSLTALHQSAKPAYAFEQTLEANRGLRYIHIKVEPPRAGYMGEAWMQIGADGQLLRMKMDYPETEDGPKVVVWQDNKAEVWFKKKECVGVFHEPKIVTMFVNMLKVFDPKLVAETLYQEQADGKVSIETKTGESITVIASVLPGNNRRTVLTVDPATKLVTQVEKYFRLKDDQYELESTWHYLEYNQEPEPGTFDLGAPADITRIDETTQVIGLAKGALTDAQITVELTREFFEALIAQDYARAGQMLSGLPAKKMQEMFGHTKFLRIVSIGEPTSQPIPGVGGMVVECQVEIEVKGAVSVQKFTPAARPVYSQPDRWNIHGGI